MIARLSISNYALIREINLPLGAGFNVITGETGAGKSVILGALSLLEGKRAASRSAIHADAPAIIEARFELPEAVAGRIEHVLMQAGLPSDGTSLTLRREISPTGRSKAVVNGSIARLDTLQELTSQLVEIHSQQANRLLASPAFQISALDAVASNSALLAQYREIYTKYRAALRDYTAMRDEIESTRRDADYLDYQYQKLCDVDPAPGEIDRLEKQREAMAANAEACEWLQKADSSLSGSDSGALPQVDRVIEALEELPDDHPVRTECLERLRTLRIELADIADYISSNSDDLEFEHVNLSEVEERLSALYSLLDRYGVRTDRELYELQQSLGDRLTRLSEGPRILNELKRAATDLKRQALAVADQISQARTDAARRLEADIVEHASPLAMPNIACKIEVVPGKLNPEGRDTVQWLFAFNKNQTPISVADTASGGEVSRVMLVLKCILAGKIGLPTIIFDEVDTGVSGDVAARMGALMAKAAKQMQLITITHLPAVAAAGEQHFKVFKRDDDSSSVTHITPLDPEGRVNEIAEMLSGSSSDPAAVAAAKSLLNRH